MVGRYGFVTSDTAIDGAIAGFYFSIIALGAIGGPAVAVHFAAKRRWVWGAIFGLIAAVSLCANVVNSLGALAGRSDKTQAERLKVRDDAKYDRAQLARVVAERASMAFTPGSEEAIAAAREAVDLAIETGLHRWAPAARLAEATLTALRGDFERAESLAAEAESVLLPMGANPLLALVELARGRNALLRGDHSVAYEHVKRISNPKDTAYHMYVRFWVVADLVEAAIQSRHEQEARDAIATLELDNEPRTLTVPLDFEAALAAEPKARAFFDALSYSQRSWFVLGIEGAKTPVTRQRRISGALDRLREGRGQR